MPYSFQGLTFGNFSVDELDELFGSGAQRSDLKPPVEFLCEFEADYEDQVGENRREVAGAEGISKSAPNGPDDSGVEVGQESEQESLPVKDAPPVHCASAEGACDQKSSRKAKDGGVDISFGGESVVEEKEVSTVNTSPTILQDPENFPPLGGLPVHDAERSRRRRRKRKQHQRSGDVPCSSSEDSDRDRSPVGSAERTLKSRSGSGAGASEKSGASLEGKKAAGGGTTGTTGSGTKDPQDTSSSTDSKSTTETGPSVGETSSSPVQSDVDNQSNNTNTDTPTVAPNDKPTPEPKVEEPPKVATGVVRSSWADLFRNTSKPSAVVVITPAPKPKLQAPPPVSKKVEETVVSVVTIDEDKQATKVAEMLKKLTLDNDAKHIFLRGLINRANWCYINATLQALLACPPFFNLLRQMQPSTNKQATATPILDSLVKFFHEFNVVSRQVNLPPGKNNKTEFRTGSSFEPNYIYKMLSTIESTLSLKGRQEDAEEFLSCVLNGIHEEMLKLEKLLQPSPKIEQQNAHVPSSDDPGVVAVKGEDMNENEDTGDWEQVGPRNKSSITRMATFPKSLISDIFGGFLRSSLHQAGSKESANVEPFFCLQLDIQNVSSIEEALNHLTVKEELHGYTCSKTKAQIDVSRRVSFEVLPKILILHLKRFIYSKTGSQKSQRHIDYPLELVIGKELLSPNVRGKYSMVQKTYKLCAVVYHHGKMACGGHYTADIHHPAHGWIHTDDTKLKPVSASMVLKPMQGKDPYLLYYRRTDQIS